MHAYIHIYIWVQKFNCQWHTSISVYAPSCASVYALQKPEIDIDCASISLHLRFLNQFLPETAPHLLSKGVCLVSFMDPPFSIWPVIVLKTWATANYCLYIWLEFQTQLLRLVQQALSWQNHGTNPKYIKCNYRVKCKCEWFDSK